MTARAKKFRVGQVWADREGAHYTIQSTNAPHRTYPVHAREHGDDGDVYAFTANGRFFAGRAKGFPWDLVSLVADIKPTPKRKAKRGRRG